MRLTQTVTIRIDTDKPERARGLYNHLLLTGAISLAESVRLLDLLDEVTGLDSPRYAIQRPSGPTDHNESLNGPGHGPQSLAQSVA